MKFEHCTCPVCQNVHGGNAEAMSAGGLKRVRCAVCGEFVVSDEAVEDYLGRKAGLTKWTPVARAALSYNLRHRINLPSHSGTKLPLIDSETLQHFEDKGIDLPTALEQARNIIRYLGDFQRLTGERLNEMPVDFYAVVGAPNPSAAEQIAIDLAAQGQIKFMQKLIDRPQTFMAARLTLDGWKEWEAIHKGQRAARDGFIAMQYGDARLDKFITDVVQPCVQEALSVKLNRLDSPEVATAGVIDNIMREAIQNAAFVLVELSHGNKGAYWEGGHAEGLGKPVIYICEKAIFDDPEKKPHFDVNHCTTVMWEEGKEEEFERALAATLRNAMRKAGRDV